MWHVAHAAHFWINTNTMSSAFELRMADAYAPKAVALFGESVTITPKSTGVGVSANAIVRRSSRETAPTGNSNRMVYERTVEIAKADYPTDKPNEGGDTIDILPNIGDTATKTYIVRRIINQTGGMWVLGLGGA